MIRILKLFIEISIDNYIDILIYNVSLKNISSIEFDSYIFLM